MTKKKQSNADQINAALEAMSKMIIAAYKSGASRETIFIEVDKAFKRIDFLDEESPKLLEKK